MMAIGLGSVSEELAPLANDMKCRARFYFQEVTSMRTSHALGTQAKVCTE